MNELAQAIKNYPCPYHGIAQASTMPDLMSLAAFKGALEHCKTLIEMNTPCRWYALCWAAKGGSANCLQFMISRFTISDLSLQMQSIIMKNAFEGRDARAIVPILLEHGWNLRNLRLPMYVPYWAWLVQFRLESRQLCISATQRALRHAGLTRDPISIIMKMMKYPDLEVWD